MRHIMLAGLVALTLGMPAAAQTPVTVDRFDEIALEGGGSVVVRQGDRQQVNLIRGSTEMTEFRVRDGRLTIDACRRSCSDYELEVEIVVPRVTALSIEGGGSIRADGGFGDPGALAASIQGGGLIDLRQIAASNVTASVNGGGMIRAHARNALTASVNGGGMITYRGDPAVTSAINGGGLVRRGG